jgi:hypothetical protein
MAPSEETTMSATDAMRVVFLPGASGTVLTDSSLAPAQARTECERNLGAVVERLLRGSALYPCDKRRRPSGVMSAACTGSSARKHGSGK